MLAGNQGYKVVYLQEAFQYYNAHLKLYFFYKKDKFFSILSMKKQHCFLNILNKNVANYVD